MTQMIAGYVWRDGFRVPSGADADAIGAELDAVIQRHGSIDLKAIAELARDPRTAMSTVLTTDPDEIADKLHLIEVREMATALHYRVVDTQTENESQGPRAFVPSGEPNVWKKVTITFTPAPARDPIGPTRIAVKPTTPKRELPPAPVATLAPPPATRTVTVIEAPIITERQARFAEQFRRMADAVRDDPYFAGVVAAVDQL